MTMNNKMKHKLFPAIILSLLFAPVFASCGQKQAEDNSATVQEVMFNDKPFARLEIDSAYDLGHFQRGENIKKTTEIKFLNTGNDTLYIRDVLPDCDCTEILFFDRKVAPQSTGVIRASMDLSEYVPGQVNKGFSIISNSRADNVRNVTLKCILD